MLQFFYTGQYDYAEASGSEIAFDTRMYNTADYYNAPTLAEHAKTRLMARAELDWKGEGLSETISEAFTFSNRLGSLHEDLVSLAFKHTDELYVEDYAAQFREVARSVPAFGALLSEKLAAHWIADSKRRIRVHCVCEDCSESFHADKLSKEGDVVGFRCPECEFVLGKHDCAAEIDFYIRR